MDIKKLDKNFDTMFVELEDIEWFSVRDRSFYLLSDYKRRLWLSSKDICTNMRCEECGVAEPARDEFVGHSRGRLNNAYSDLSEVYLLKERKNLIW